MKEHVQRMHDELDALKDKRWKLGKFIVGRGPFQDLHPVKQALMIAQHGHMSAYITVLEMRIEAEDEV